MTCYFGDCREVMRSLIAEGVRVQMCVTSPPYWGLRDYGTAGQLGLESTPAEYVANMVEVFALVRDLLADDGTCWINLGDSYNANQGNGFDTNQDGGARKTAAASPRIKWGKPKDLVGIPWRVAFALQADGWYLRQDIIWAKPNPMPESVTDRCTKAHEYLFLLAKRSSYYYDAAAIKEPASENTHPGYSSHGSKTQLNDTEFGVKPSKFDGYRPEERNRRSVWTVPTAPYAEAHFATFPPALIEPCILAGSRPNDIVLDPFLGSGTTGQVAQDLGRRWLGIELNESYRALQERRTAQQAMVFS